MDNPFYKYRCTSCKQEKRTVVLWKGREKKVGACDCKPPQTYEMVPLTKKRYFERLA